MSPWLIAAVGVVYFYIGCDLWWKGDIGLSIAFFGYSFSNVGLYLAAQKASGI